MILKPKIKLNYNAKFFCNELVNDLNNKDGGAGINFIATFVKNKYSITPTQINVNTFSIPINLSKVSRYLSKLFESLISYPATKI